MSIERQNQCLNYYVNTSFHGVHRLFVLSFEDNTVRLGHTRYFLPTVQINDYSVMIHRQNIFDQPVTNDVLRLTTFKKLKLVKAMTTQRVIYFKKIL